METVPSNDTDRAELVAAAASKAAALLAAATADAAAVLARATAQASIAVDEERNRKIDVMYDRSGRVETALFGDGGRGGVISDVSNLKSQMSFIKWAGGIGSALTLATIGSFITHIIH